MASAPEPQTRTDVQVAVLGAGLDHHAVHGRHADEDGGPPLLDGVEHLDRVEARQQVHREPGAGQPIAREAHDVGDRQAEHGLVAAQPRRPGAAAGDLPDQRPVRELGALGLARWCPRCRRARPRRRGRPAAASVIGSMPSSSVALRTTSGGARVATTWATSSGRICGLTGTASAPARAAARHSRSCS